MKNRQIALLCFLVFIMPLVFTVTDFVVTPKNRLMGAFKTFKQIILIISFIPYEAFLMVKAIGTTLFRLIFQNVIFLNGSHHILQISL